jgi:hypothetical protein
LGLALLLSCHATAQVREDSEQARNVTV